MKFLVPNYSCLQNPWLRGYSLQIPVLSVLCPQLNFLTPPPPKKFLGTPLEEGQSTVSYMSWYRNWRGKNGIREWRLAAHNGLSRVSPYTLLWWRKQSEFPVWWKTSSVCIIWRKEMSGVKFLQLTTDALWQTMTHPLLYLFSREFTEQNSTCLSSMPVWVLTLRNMKLRL